MLIPLAEVVAAGVKPGATIHVGAHLGEEAGAYEQHGFKPVYWLEANHEKLDQLRRNVEPLGGVVIPALVSDTSGRRTFHLASNGQSSSYYELGTHATEHPDVTYVSSWTLKATTLDELADGGKLGELATFLCMDVQGAELDVLRGAEKVLAGIEAAYLEVNTEDVYRGCALEPEVTAWLEERGFRKVLSKITPHGWGDQLYMR